MQQPKPQSEYYLPPRRKMAYRLVDAFLALAGLTASIITLYGLPYGSVYYGNSSEADIGGFITLMIIAGAQMWLALTFITLVPFVPRPKTTVASAVASSSRPFWYQFSILSVILMWIISLPWIFINLGDQGPWLMALLIVPFMIALGALFGALAWLFVTVPINMLVRSLGAFFIKRDRSVAPLLVLSVMLLSMAAIIITMPMAVETGRSGQAAYPSMIAAVLGIPGDYYVQNETAYVIGRIAGAVAVITIILWVFVLGTRKNSAQKYVDSGFVGPVVQQDAPKKNKK